MTSKANRPPAEAWVWQTRALRASDAWRSQSINARRFVDFLLLEHMAHGGKHNGNLKAPRRQLEAFGVGARHLTDTIRETEELGLVDCHRGGMRVATAYALTWLPLHDGTPASNRWQAFRNPALAPLPGPKSRNLPAKGKSALPAKGKSDSPNLPAKGKSACPQSLLAKGKHLYRKSYQDGATVSVEKGAAGAAPGRPAN